MERSNASVSVCLHSIPHCSGMCLLTSSRLPPECFVPSFIFMPYFCVSVCAIISQLLSLLSTGIPNPSSSTPLFFFSPCSNGNILTPVIKDRTLGSGERDRLAHIRSVCARWQSCFHIPLLQSVSWLVFSQLVTASFLLPRCSCQWMAVYINVS